MGKGERVGSNYKKWKSRLPPDLEDLPFDRWPGKQSQRRCPPLHRQEVQAHCQALLTQTCCPAATGGSEMAWFPGIHNYKSHVYNVVYRVWQTSCKQNFSGRCWETRFLDHVEPFKFSWTVWANLVTFWPLYPSKFPHMGQIPQDGKNGQNMAFFNFFDALLWPNGMILFNFSEEILSVTI